jgi:hypothetical protein
LRLQKPGNYGPEKVLSDPIRASFRLSERPSPRGPSAARRLEQEATVRRRSIIVFVAVAVAALAGAAVAIASSVDVAVVDVTAPTGSVTLEPGQSADITINLSVTGRQEGTATFELYRTWTLSGGTFTGSNAQEFTVLPREAADPATTFTTTGTVVVTAGEAAGTRTLAVDVFDITNSNDTGAKLSEGSPSSYQVTVLGSAPSDTTPPVITAPGDITVLAAGPSGASVSFSASAVDDVDGSAPVGYSAAPGSTFAIGTTTVTVSAEDSAGNRAEKTFKVNVLYRYSGILAPINADDSSVFKQGSTVPVKFKLSYADGAPAGEAVAKLTLRKLSNGILGDELEAYSTAAATSGNLFRYDATGQLYIFNLGTKALEPGTWRLTISLSDGTSQSVDIGLKK